MPRKHRSVAHQFADLEPHTRAGLVDATGLARATVEQRLDELVGGGWIEPAGAPLATGGRPAEAFVIKPSRGALLVADVGSSHSRIALTDFTGEIKNVNDVDLDIADGPDVVLGTIRDEFASLLRNSGANSESVLGVTIGMPGPVEVTSGKVVRPPTMPGWDGIRIPDHFHDFGDRPLVVDKDANLMALGEHRHAKGAFNDALLIKMGTGIGAAIIMNGELYRGAQGMAGDLGHIPSPQSGAVCRCGQRGCAEATSSAWAISAELRKSGHESVRTSADVVALASRQDAEAIALLRDAGRVLGVVAAYTVSIINPDTIILAGDLAAAHGPVIAGMKEAIYQRSHPLATQDLRITTSKLGAIAGLTGAACAAIDAVLEKTGI